MTTPAEGEINVVSMQPFCTLVDELTKHFNSIPEGFGVTITKNKDGWHLSVIPGNTKITAAKENRK